MTTVRRIIPRNIAIFTTVDSIDCVWLFFWLSCSLSLLFVPGMSGGALWSLSDNGLGWSAARLLAYFLTYTQNPAFDKRFVFIWMRTQWQQVQLAFAQESQGLEYWSTCLDLVAKLGPWSSACFRPQKGSFPNGPFVPNASRFVSLRKAGKSRRQFGRIRRPPRILYISCFTSGITVRHFTRQLTLCTRRRVVMPGFKPTSQRVPRVSR